MYIYTRRGRVLVRKSDAVLRRSDEVFMNVTNRRTDRPTDGQTNYQRIDPRHGNETNQRIHEGAVL